MTAPNAPSPAPLSSFEPANFEPTVEQQHSQQQAYQENTEDITWPLLKQCTKTGTFGHYTTDGYASNNGAPVPYVDDDAAPLVPSAPSMPPAGRRSGTQSPFRLSLPLLSPGQLAFTALQFLPVPVLVLNNLKTVVLANDAMGRILGLTRDGPPGHQDDGVAISDKLRGQTLSQVGIDMIQDGKLAWISWESFFDELVARVGTKCAAEPCITHIESQDHNSVHRATDSELAATSAGISDKPGSDCIVDVVILSREVDRANVPNLRTSEYQTLAKMIITIWEIEDRQVYYTLTFTNAESTASHIPGPQISVARPSALDAAERKTIARSSPPSSQCSNSPGIALSPAAVSVSTGPFPPMGPPSRSPQSIPLSSLQKMTIIKDALLDNTEMPIMAMWKDRSAPVLNKAARRLFQNSTEGEGPDGYDLETWEVWDDRFTRKYEPSEFPISILLREQRPFSGHRIGVFLKDTNTKIVYDILGEVITDNETGEFVAGVITCRDVTHIAQEISQIKEEDEERFKLICDTMPQMVWTATSAGLHDFFNNRWYDYTGLSPEDSLGRGWEQKFHPDDMPESDRRWKECLETGAPFATEYRCLSKKGEWRWMLGRALPLRNKRTGKIEKWFGTCTDVHETLEARMAARRTRDELQQVLRHAQTTIFSVDRDRKVTMLEGALITDVEKDCTADDESARDSQRYIGQDVDQVFNDLNPQLPPGEIPGFLTPVKQLLSGTQPDATVFEHKISKSGFYLAPGGC